MLVIERAEGQAILIGPDIVVTVSRISGRTRVKLAIQAPASVRIDRPEWRNERPRMEMSATTEPETMTIDELAARLKRRVECARRSARRIRWDVHAIDAALSMGPRAAVELEPMLRGLTAAIADLDEAQARLRNPRPGETGAPGGADGNASRRG